MCPCPCCTSEQTLMCPPTLFDVSKVLTYRQETLRLNGSMDGSCRICCRRMLTWQRASVARRSWSWTRRTACWSPASSRSCESSRPRSRPSAKRCCSPRLSLAALPRSKHHPSETHSSSRWVCHFIPVLRLSGVHFHVHAHSCRHVGPVLCPKCSLSSCSACGWSQKLPMPQFYYAAGI